MTSPWKTLREHGITQTKAKVHLKKSMMPHLSPFNENKNQRESVPMKLIQKIKTPYGHF